MPLFEYVCGSCGRKSELLLAKVSSKPACPACGSRKMSRQFSTFSAHGAPSKPDACAAAGLCPSSRRCPGSCPMSTG